MKIFIIFLSLPEVYIQPPLWYTRRAMENPRENPLPLPTIRRYPIFLRAIGEMMDAGEAFISSSVLAERLGLDPVLTRKDLAMARSFRVSTGSSPRRSASTLLEMNASPASIISPMARRKIGYRRIVGSGSGFSLGFSMARLVYHNGG